MRSRGWWLFSLLLVATAGMRAQVALTTVQDTVYNSGGVPTGGTVLVSWSAFTSAGGSAIPAGTTSAAIAAGGALTVALAPNQGAMPIGSYYTAVFHLTDGTTSRQFWVVPAVATGGTVKLAAIETTVLPTSVAMQTVNKAYVDNAIVKALTGVAPDSAATPYVLKPGDAMTGPLVLPGDPVSALQAADKNYVDTSVAQLAGGGSTKVSTVPTASQTVAQPAGTALEVNALNGVLDATGWQTGNGNNGFANALGSGGCAGGCEVRGSQSYLGTESVPAGSIPAGGRVVDARGGAVSTYTVNPLGPGAGSYISSSVSQMSTATAQQAVAARPGIVGPNSFTEYLMQTAPTGGSNQFPASHEAVPYGKSNYGVLQLTGNYNTQGQHVQFNNDVNCYSVGDCLAGGQFILSAGGYRDEADEGTHPFDLQVSEDPRVFQGTCGSGCATGATSLLVNATANGGTQGDGRFLIDKSPAKVISAGSIVSSGGDLFPTVNFSGTNFAASVFLTVTQGAGSQASNLAPGTVTLPIATSGVQTGFQTSTAALPATSGVACVADTAAPVGIPNFETARYAVVDATHLQLTLNKVHYANAAVAVGGLCGYGLEETVDTVNGVRQVFPVIGSLSGTALYYAAGNTSVVGNAGTGSTSGYLNASVTIASAVRSGGVVTLTTATALPADLNGLSLTVSGVADSNYDGTFAVATTGSNTLTYADAGADGTSTGGTVGVLTGGFNLYPMAEVLSVWNAATKAVDGSMALAPNTVAWAAGDAVEEPHYHQQLVDADTELITQFVPKPVQYSSAGKTYGGAVGPGTRGWEIANGSAASNYLGGGGTHQAPDAALMTTGVWRDAVDAVAGENSLLRVHCNLHGCNRWDSGYALFSLDARQGQDFLFYDPNSDTASWTLGGTGYSFSPQAFTAGNVSAGTVSAGTVKTGGLQATGGAVSGLTAFSLGTANTMGNFVWQPNAVHYGTYQDPYVGLYDGSKYIGITASLPAPAGTAMLGGYYSGMGVGGMTAGTATPIFGVLSSAQVGNGLGNVAFTVTDSNLVETFRNTLDDGNGNMTVAGKLAVGKGVVTGTGSNTDLAGTLVLPAGATSSAGYSFAGGYGSAPVCVVQPQSLTPAVSQAMGGYVPQVSAGGLSGSVGAAPTAAVSFGYVCVAGR